MVRGNRPDFWAWAWADFLPPLVQGKQAGRPVRLFATQADNSASAAGAAPKLEQQASVLPCSLNMLQDIYCDLLQVSCSHPCMVNFRATVALTMCFQGMMGPYAKYGLTGAGAGLLFYAFGAQTGGPVSVPGSSCKLNMSTPCHLVSDIGA